jgi:hypothetical protein
LIIDNDVVLVLDDAGPVVVLLITCGTALIDGCNDGDIVMVGPILLLLSLPFSSEEGDVVNDVTLDEDDTNVVVFDDGLALTLGIVLIDGRREGGLVIVGTIVKEGDVVDDVISNAVVFDDGLALTLGRVLIDGRREGGLVIVGTIVKEGDVVDDVILDVFIDGSTVGDREYVGGPLLSIPPISIP